jgi:hypothetical protein
MLGRFFVPGVLLAMSVTAYTNIEPKIAQWATIALIIASLFQQKISIPTYVRSERDTNMGATFRDLLRGSFYTHNFASARNEKPKSPHVHVCMGVRGITVSNDTYILDMFRLTQPLLARIPSDYIAARMPGHNETTPNDNFVPWGYWDTRTPEIITHPEIRELANLIYAATKQSVWDWSRIPKIIKLISFKLSDETKFLLRYKEPKEVVYDKVEHLPSAGMKIIPQAGKKSLQISCNQHVQLLPFKDFKLIGNIPIRVGKQNFVEIPKNIDFIMVAPDTPNKTEVTIKQLE